MAETPSASGQDSGHWLLTRLPAHVAESLSAGQQQAIHQALDKSNWGNHPVNIRLSIPFFGKRFYLTIVGGSERRTADRRAQERVRHPVYTAANILFVIGIGALFYIFAAFALAIHSSLIEF